MVKWMLLSSFCVVIKVNPCSHVFLVFIFLMLLNEKGFGDFVVVVQRSRLGDGKVSRRGGLRRCVVCRHGEVGGIAHCFCHICGSEERQKQSPKLKWRKKYIFLLGKSPL